MSHVDEGVVHAYLDDALDDAGRVSFEHHIAECAECAAMLRAEERVRDSAAALLMRAAPEEIAAPPFAGVRARSSAAPVRAPATRRVPPLAWAAMLVIGLGSAVMTARYIQLDTGKTERMSDVAAPSAASPEVPQAAQTEATAEEGVFAGGANTGGVQPGARIEAAPRPAPERALAEADAAPPPALQQQQQRADTRELATRERVARDEVRAETAEAARGADRPAFENLATGAVAAAPSPPPPMPAPAPAAPPPAASSAVDVTSGRAAAANAWRASTQAEAEELLGARMARVPGVAVLSVEVLPSEPPIVRVRQPLGAAVLELTQQRVVSSLRRGARQQDAASSARNSVGAAEGSASGTMAKAGSAAVAVRRGDVLITAQAPVTADSLSALLRRVE